MKKLLSIFLSVLLSLVFSVTNAQGQDCCFWLENMQSETLTGIVNAPDGSGNVVLNNTMNRAYLGNVDTYQIRFVNNCNLPDSTKLSIEWKLYRNGVLLNDHLSNYCEFAIYTYYDRQAGLDGGWKGSVVRDGHGWYSSEDNIEGFPGAMQVNDNGSSSLAAGYWNDGGNPYLSLDYFKLPYFLNTESKVVIKWKQTGDYSLVISLRERIGGTDYPTLYWNGEQNQSVGGHQSIGGDIIASDSVHYLVKTTTYKEVCEGSTFEFGSPLYTFDEEGDYLVIFGHDICDHFVVDRLDTLHFFTRRNPQIIAPDLLELCANSPDLNVSYIKALAELDTVPTAGNPETLIEWSNDGTNYSVDTDPIIYTEPGTYHYFVRQTNVYRNFGETIICEGPAKDITLIIHPVPEAPQVTPGYVCEGDTFYITDLATADPDCELIWDPPFTDPMADTHTPGEYTYTVYQKNTITGCFSPDNVSTVSLIVFALPEVTATADPDAICLGDEITLKADPDTYDSYTWSTGDVTAQCTYTPDAVGTYTFTVTVTEDHVITTFGVIDTITCSKEFTTNEVIVSPIPDAPEVEVLVVEICNEDPATTQLLTAVPGENGTTCRWYLDGELKYTGNEYLVTLSDIRPAENVEKIVVYKVTSYNEETGCETAMEDAATATIHFYPTPEMTLSPESGEICPGDEVTITATITNTTMGIYEWSGDVTSFTNNIATLETSAIVCDSIYKVIVKATDIHGCSTTDSLEFHAIDDEPITITPAASELHIPGCDPTAIPEAYTTVQNFTNSLGLTIEDHCDNLKSVTYRDTNLTPDEEICTFTIKRTYTLEDVCGHTADHVQMIFITDLTKPVIEELATPVNVDPVVADNCTYNAPSRDDLLEAMDAHFSPNDNCAEKTYLFKHAVFTLEDGSIAEDAEDIFNGNETGIYIWVHVVDKCGNSSDTVKNIFIPRPPMITIENSITATPAEICLGDTVNLTFDPTKIIHGTAPYTYTWIVEPTDGEFQVAEHGLTAFSVPASASKYYKYTLEITDANQCKAIDKDSVYVNPLPTINTITTNAPSLPVCPNFGELEITVDAQSNIADAPGLTYIWTGEGLSNTSAQTAKLAIDPENCDHTYTADVTVMNIKNCVAHSSIDIPVLDNEAPVITGLDAEITVSLSKGCKVLLPDIVAMLTSENVTDNCYAFGDLTITQEPDANIEITENTRVTLTVSDPCGNSNSDFTILVKPQPNLLKVTIDAEPDKICRGDNAELTANVTGQNGEVTYLWNNSQTASQITVTPDVEGTITYSVTVTDDLDCEAFDTVTLTIYHIPELTVTTKANRNCKEPKNGSIKVTADVPCTFKLGSSISAGLLTSYIFTGLGADNYTITAISESGCQKEIKATVTDSSEAPKFTVETEDNTFCREDEGNGSITITVTDQSIAEDCQYSLDDITYQTSPVFQNLMAGLYTVYVKDMTTECVSSKDVTVGNDIKLPEFNLTVKHNTLCFNDRGNGSITVNVVNPNTSTTYQYSKDNINYQSSPVFDNLMSGTYTIYVKDITTNCVSSKTVSVEDEEPVYQWGTPTVEPNTVCDETMQGNGSITVTIVGHNVNEFKYSIDNGTTYQTLNKFENLKDNTYTIRAFNIATGCYKDTDIVVPHVPHLPILTTSSTPNHNCEAPWDGTITVEADVNCTFELGTITSPSSMSHTFNGLGAGTYTITATSEVGCENNADVTVGNDITLPEFNLTVEPNTLCRENVGNGSITVNVVNPNTSTNYQYSKEGTVYQESNVFENLVPGEYTIYVKDMTTRCVSHKDTNVITDNDGAPRLTITPQNGKYCLNATDAKIKVNAENDISDDTFEYLWNSGETTNLIHPSTATAGTVTYTVTVTSVKTGCKNTISTNVTVHALPVITILINDEDKGSEVNVCQNETPFTLKVQEIYPSYTWDDASTGRELTVNTLVGDTSFSVVVVDANGCTNTKEIKIHAIPIYETSVSVNLCVDENDSVTYGGKGFKFDRTPNATNIYTFKSTTLKSIFGCDSIVNYNITLMAKPTVTLTNATELTNIHCHGDIVNPVVTVVDNNSPITAQGWHSTLPAFNPANPLEYSMNNEKVWYYAENACGKDSTEKFTLKVDSMPEFGPIADNKVKDIVCGGTEFSYEAPTVTWNTTVTSDCTTHWLIGDGTSFDTLAAKPEKFTTDMDGKFVKFIATNHCGTSESNTVELKVDTIIIAQLTSDEDFCIRKGVEIVLTDFGFNSSNLDKYTADLQLTKKFHASGNNSEVELDFPVKIDDHFTVGEYDVYYKFENHCGHSTTNTVKMRINGKPIVDPISDFPHCIDECNSSFNTYIPGVKANGFLPITAQGWQIEDEEGNWTNIPNDYNFSLSDNGKEIRYYATNDCGTNYSNTITLNLADKPEATLTSVPPVCSGSLITPDYNIEYNNGTTQEHHFEWKTTTPREWTCDNIIARYAYNGDSIRLIAKNECGSDTTNYVVVKVDTNFLEITYSDDPICYLDGAEIKVDAAATETSITIDDNVVTYTFNPATKTYSLDTKNLTDSTTITGKITTLENQCPAVEKEFTIKVNGKPEVAWNGVYEDTVCVGTSYDLPGVNVDYNSYSDNNSIQYFVVVNDEWIELTNLEVANITYDKCSLFVIANNGCDKDTSTAITLHVMGEPTIGDFEVQAACNGSALRNFIVGGNPPTVTPQGSTEILTKGWQLFNGTTWINVEETTPVFANTYTKVRYYAGTKCDTVYSEAKDLLFKYAPKFDSDEITGLETCHNSTLEFPVLGYNDGGSPLISVIWEIVITADSAIQIDESTIFTTDWDGLTVRCIITNECGSDMASGIVRVYPLPTPVVSDTLICENNYMQLLVTDPVSTSTYTWTVDGEEKEDASFVQFGPYGLTPPNVHTAVLVVTEEDEHGCKNTDTGYVRVTAFPMFIFRDSIGREIHELDQITGTQAGPFTRYSVELSNCDYPVDTMVYLEVRLYHNGNLMWKDMNFSSPHHVDSCIFSQIPPYWFDASTHNPWYITDLINWRSSKPSLHEMSNVSYYEYTPIPETALRIDGGFHYPHNSFVTVQTTNLFDCLYLHFLLNRPIYTAVAPFKKAGEYKIVYQLYSTSNDDRFENLYYNDTLDANLHIGGHYFKRAGSLLTLLAVDTLVIHVTGENAVTAPSPAPSVTSTGTGSGTATMRLYPNPVTIDRSVSVVVDGMEGSSILMISDLSGKVLTRENIKIPSGITYKHTQTISDYSPGIYFVTLKSENATITRKLVITK